MRTSNFVMQLIFFRLTYSFLLQLKAINEGKPTCVVERKSLVRSSSVSSKSKTEQWIKHSVKTPSIPHWDALQTGWHCSHRSSPALSGSGPLANRWARRATSIQTPPIAFPNWLETTGFHRERDGIAITGDHWPRGLSVVLYKQAIHCTWSPMLSV